MPRRIEKALTVSIIIPAYNEECHLIDCLDTIKAQSVMPDEVIVVDNNSTDRTVAIAQKYSFVKVVKENQQGIVWARNAGFNAAKGDIIGRIDADTHLPTNWVEYVKNFYAEPHNATSAVTGGAYFYNIHFSKLGGWMMSQVTFRMNRLLLGHYITYGSNMAFPAFMWRDIKHKTCHETNIHEDLDLSIHLHEHGYHITYKEKFRVGVKMRRVLSSRKDLWENLLWWPRTLRHHNKKTWVVGLAGAMILYVLSPIVILIEIALRPIKIATKKLEQSFQK